MNAPLRHPQEAASAVSLPWHVVLRPFMGAWEPVIIAGEALAFNYPNLARAAARGYPGAIDRFMGYSASRPTVEAVRAAANPAPTPCPPVSFDIEAMDAYGVPNERSSFDSWR